MKVIRTIGVLTSVDAPNNHAIRAVVRTIKRTESKRNQKSGYSGLQQEHIGKQRDVSDTIQRGGTILLISLPQEMRTPEGQQKAAAPRR